MHPLTWLQVRYHLSPRGGSLVSDMATTKDVRGAVGSDKDAEAEYKWFESDERAQVVVDEVVRQEAKKLDEKTQVGWWWGVMVSL